jgi:hypothetical protein
MRKSANNYLEEIAAGTPVKDGIITGAEQEVPMPEQPPTVIKEFLFLTKQVSRIM